MTVSFKDAIYGGGTGGSGGGIDATQFHTLFDSSLQTAISDGTITNGIGNVVINTFHSTTSVPIALGTLNMTIETGKTISNTTFLLIAADVDKYMHGQVVSYDSSTGALVVDVTTISALTGTFAAWTLTASSPVVVASGLQIDMTSPAFNYILQTTGQG